MIKSVHPFPARMSPGLALDSLAALPPQSAILDPMAGSGTVLRQAIQLGHSAQGFDVDPLAVLMASVWTTHVADDVIGRWYERLSLVLFSDSQTSLAWFDQETSDFIDYWFDLPQREQLTRIASALAQLSSEVVSPEDEAALNILRLNLSRIIVTKRQAASLARDTSHSRPHRVSLNSDYDVLQGYGKALRILRERLKDQPPSGSANIDLGDARTLQAVATHSFDAVVTSPPYLNAIDYLRGHRMALVWLGWKISELRAIRSGSIGAERGPDQLLNSACTDLVVTAMIGNADLPRRHRRMIDRYADDLRAMISEVGRVLKPGGRAIFVVGNSCLKGVFIRNADGLATAAIAAGLKETDRSERELPESSRYLPVTGTALAKRMRTESVLSFAA